MTSEKHSHRHVESDVEFAEETDSPPQWKFRSQFFLSGPSINRGRHLPPHCFSHDLSSFCRRSLFLVRTIIHAQARCSSGRLHFSARAEANNNEGGDVMWLTGFTSRSAAFPLPIINSIFVPFVDVIVPLRRVYNQYLCRYSFQLVVLSD